MARHDPASYRAFRPEYPNALFERLRAHLLRGPGLVVDLGAGTGLSISSMIRARIPGPFVGVEPDAAMLEVARRQMPPSESLEWREAPAESTGLPDGCAAGVTIASAYHWMRRPEVDREILRLTRPGACVQVFEYQFPKAPGAPELSEWIRRRFNETWRLQDQKPRGSLREMCRALIDGTRVEEVQDLANSPALHTLVRDLTLDELVGLIFSQARALSYLERLPDDVARDRHREETRESLRRFYENAGLERIAFHFKLAGLFIRLR